MNRITRASIVVAAIAAIVVASLSIHVVMLQVIGVPYPDMRGLGGLMRLYPVAQSLGIVWLAAATAPAVARYHPILRWLIVAALFAAMNGLLRNALMEAVTTTSFIAPIGGLVRQLLLDLALAGLAVVVVSVIPNALGRLAGAAAIAAAWLFLISRALGTMLLPLTRWATSHAHPVVYDMPYGANVLIPSYLSFAETVTACLIARLAVTFRQARWDPSGLVRYTLLVLLVRGTLVLTLLSPLIGANAGEGMLSVSQFLLQDIAMVLLIQVAVGKLYPEALRRAGR